LVGFGRGEVVDEEEEVTIGNSLRLSDELDLDEEELPEGHNVIQWF